MDDNKWCVSAESYKSVVIQAFIRSLLFHLLSVEWVSREAGLNCEHDYVQHDVLQTEY